MQKIDLRKIFLGLFLIGISLGIILAEVLHLGLFFSLFTLLLLGGIIFLVFILRHEKLFSGILIIFVIFLLGLNLGILRTNVTEKKFILTKFAGEKVVIFGAVAGEPEDRGSYLALMIRVEVVSTESICEVVSEQVLVRADRFVDVEYGDIVRASGRIDLPEPFATDTGRVFRYDKFLEKDSVGTILPFAQIEFIEQGKGGFVKRFLFKTKARYLQTVGRFIPDPEASLLGGLTVGAKRSLGKDLERDFRLTGLIHIVVLSGYNVVIVAEAIMFSLRYFSNKLRTILGIVAIGLFVILVGAGATIVRAGLMAAIALAARSFGREALALQALFFAGILMLVFNPMLLLHDPSFQLSFVATLGLILFSEPMERLFVWIRNRTMREITTATISVQIAVLPLLVYSVGELSIVALPANLLVLASVPSAMLFGFLTGLFGVIPFVSVFLGPVFGVISFLILKYQLFVVNVFAGLPFAAVTLPQFPFVFVVLIYVVFGFALWKIKRLALKQGESFSE